MVAIHSLDTFRQVAAQCELKGKLVIARFDGFRDVGHLRDVVLEIEELLLVCDWAGRRRRWSLLFRGEVALKCV